MFSHANQGQAEPGKKGAHLESSAWLAPAPARALRKHWAGAAGAGGTVTQVAPSRSGLRPFPGPPGAGSQPGVIGVSEGASMGVTEGVTRFLCSGGIEAATCSHKAGGDLAAG